MTSDDAGSTRIPIWARPPARRGTGLSRAAVVEAAVAVADAEGLDAVSIRRVAAELSARAMTLYTYIDSKDDLLDLMSDQIAGEVLLEGDLPGDWREAISLIARRERDVTLRHPWMVEMVNRRSHAVIGPNSLRHLDQSVAAVAGLKLEPSDTYRVVAAVDDYVLGYVTREVREREIVRRTGAVPAARLSELRPYLERLVDNGEYANIAPLLRGDVQVAASDFEQGLNWLLDGIERACS